MTEFDSVILITGVPGSTCAGWAADFVIRLAEGFRRLGLATRLMTLSKDNEQTFLKEVRGLYDMAVRSGRKPFVLDINGKNAVHLPGIPCFIHVVDHPLVHPHLHGADAHTVLGMIDRNHAAIDGYTTAKTSFLPHGGPLVTRPGKAHKDRKIPFLFCGNLQCAPDRESFLGALASAAPLAQDIIMAAADQAAETYVDPFDALTEHCAARGAMPSEFGREALARILDMVSVYSETCHRWRILQALRGNELHVIGKIPDHVRRELRADAFIYRGSQSFDVFMACAEEARVLINCSAKFPAGAHERVFYGMAKGCAVATTGSTFLAESFTNAGGILFYKDPDELAEVINGADGRCFEAMASKAQPVYSSKHTWAVRAAGICRSMRTLSSPSRSSR